ncbi:MAG: winged helix DNA-binding domain-containing protein [Actinomycetota bacterium]|nr:winged helix DNA-binding domain-containing protein [Actinomycetota bacterium]
MHDLVALHSTDPASVFVSTMARTVEPGAAALERALYDERSLLRMLGMRRTMFVVGIDIAPTIHAACTKSIAARERLRLVRFVEQSGVADDGAAWLRQAEADTLEALTLRGEATGAELSAAVPALREQFSYREDRKWGGVQNFSSRVLFLMAADGLIVRGRPRGSWISSQYRWALLPGWLPQGLPDLEVGAAQAELARRWLRTFAPATLDDLRWWTGWTAAEARRAVAQLSVTEVDLDGRPGMVLADDVEPVASPEPWAALLPALDPTVMGWTDRGWYLGQHRAALFDRSGNAGPTVWWDGRVVGGWAQRKDGEIAIRLLEDLGTEAKAAVGAMAARLRDAIGPIRITPRFGTPLQLELLA